MSYVQNNYMSNNYNDPNVMNIRKEDDLPFQDLYKIVITGDSGIGKSCLMQRFCDNTYYDCNRSTIGADFRSKDVSIPGNNTVRLQIWDTAGQETFRALTQSYYRGAKGIIVAFDINNRTSFEHAADHWLQEAYKNCGNTATIILVSTKSDLKKMVSREDIISLCERHKLTYLESSARESHNVEKTFAVLIQEIIRNDKLKDRGTLMTESIFLDSKKYINRTKGNSEGWGMYNCCST